MCTPTQPPPAWLERARPRELRRHLARITRDDATADDLAQEALLRLASEARAGRTPDDPAAWLRRVATNLATSRARRCLVAARGAEALRDDEAAASPEALAMDRQRAEAVRVALAALPESERALVTLAADGVDGDGLAAATSRTTTAARTALCRARAKLRAALTHH